MRSEVIPQQLDNPLGIMRRHERLPVLAANVPASLNLSRPVPNTRYGFETELPAMARPGVGSPDALLFLAIDRQRGSELGELGEGGFELLDDLGGEYSGGGQGAGVIEGLIA